MRTLQVIFALALALAPACLFAAKHAPTESGMVISQNLDTERAGAAALPMGTAIIAVPLYRRSNTVEVETAQYRYTWIESGNKPIILAVGEAVEFYRDKDWFVVLDSRGKGHKFGVVSQVARSKR